MARVCQITGRKTITGNRRSHANNKTRRKFIVNLQRKNFFLKELGIFLPLSISTRAMRTIHKHGLIPTLRKAQKKNTLEKSLIPLVGLLRDLKHPHYEQEK